MRTQILNKKYGKVNRSFLITFLLIAAVSMTVIANVVSNTNDDLCDLEDTPQYEVIGDALSITNGNMDYEHQSNFDGDTSQSLGLPVTTSSGTSYTYTIYGDWGRTWEDAEKIWFDDGEGNPRLNRPGDEDDLMCWAASASNILRWTGWGGGASADALFYYFQEHWTDVGGNAYYGWKWWFEGTNPSQGWDDWSQVDQTGGGFWSNSDLWRYYERYSSESDALPNIDYLLREGYGVGLGISGGIEHAITCWGFDYDSSNPDKYVGIWVTDSDDTKSKIFPKNVHKDWLRHYEVEKSGGRWYLQDYGGSDSRYISDVQGLGAGPGIAPKVDAGSDNQVNEGSNFRFSGDYVNPGPSPTNKWYFGDGTTQTGNWYPYHKYGDNGVYTVTLEVTDEHGDVGTDTLTMTVANVAPTVNAGSDQICDEGSLVSFTGTHTDPGILDTHTYVWDFGDGSPSASGNTTSHIYADNGVYTVTLTVTDDDGGVGTDTLTVTVNNVAPTANAGADKTADEGSAVSFVGTHFDPGILDTHTYVWDFGDGSPIVYGTAATHIYADNGVYTVTLTVTDDDGGVGTDTLIVTVYNVAPTANAGSDQIGDEGSVVSFTGTHFDPGILDTHTYVWDFGDGSPSVPGTTVSHIFADNGVYTVFLTVTDNDGGVGTDMLIMTVYNVAPTVEIVSFNQTQFFVLEDLTVIMLDNVYFNGTAFDPGSDDLTFTWNWGDNTIETMNSYINDPPSYPVEIHDLALHAYAQPGEFTVTLTVEDDDGGFGTATLTLTVWGPQDLKKDVLLDLESARVGTTNIDKHINRTIRFIEWSLAEKYWTDATHIDPKHGGRVFCYEFIPELQLAKILTDQLIYELIVYKLVKADELIARVALSDAENTPVKTEKYQQKVDCELATAHEYLAKAIGENEDLTKAIHYYWKSWEHAQNAIEFANK